VSPITWLLPLSTLLGGVGIALSGVSGSYGLTLAFVAISGLGVAAYHPESARLARLASGGSHRAMSWFSLGGNIGFALAPLMVAALSWLLFRTLPEPAAVVHTGIVRAERTLRG